MAKTGCTVTYWHPTTVVTKELLTTLGQYAAQSISAHTQQGLSAEGRPMRPLTVAYARAMHGGDRTRRLKLTGKMLLSARLKYERSAVAISWIDPKAEWHQKASGWIGLSSQEQQDVSARLQQTGRISFNRYLQKKTKRY